MKEDRKQMVGFEPSIAGQSANEGIKDPVAVLCLLAAPVTTGGPLTALFRRPSPVSVAQPMTEQGVSHNEGV